jgi:hypothetical protein
MTVRGAIVFVVLAAVAVLVYLRSQPAAAAGGGAPAAGGGGGGASAPGPAAAPAVAPPKAGSFIHAERVLATGGGTGTGPLKPQDAPVETRGDAVGAGLAFL